MNLLSSDPTYPLFPVFAFVGFVVVLIPLPWHFQAWNAGTCLYMIWAALSCLNQFINSVVWHANALNPAPVWCDISSRLIVGIAVAFPAASLCINRRLYKIATTQYVSITLAQKRRVVYEDLAVGLGIPVLQMGLHYIVTGHRFDILEDVGCWPVTVNVWLSYPLVLCWPVAIGCVSAVYCVLTLVAFYKKKNQFASLIASNSSLTLHRYFRLMALATTELLCTVPFASFIIYLDVTAEPISPYHGWNDLHFDFTRVDQIPRVVWHLNPREATAIELTRWLMLICAFIFFLFFGFAEEARRNYSRTFSRIVERVRWGSKVHIVNHPSTNIPVIQRTNVLPVFVAKERDTIHDSTSSLASSIASPRDSKKNSSILALSPTSPSDSVLSYYECYGHAY